MRNRQTGTFHRNCTRCWARPSAASRTEIVWTIWTSAWTAQTYGVRHYSTRPRTTGSLILQRKLFPAWLFLESISSHTLYIDCASTRHFLSGDALHRCITLLIEQCASSTEESRAVALCSVKIRESVCFQNCERISSAGIGSGHSIHWTCAHWAMCPLIKGTKDSCSMRFIIRGGMSMTLEVRISDIYPFIF